MAKPLKPEKAFPSEVLKLRSRGVPLPTWYAGSLYTGNGSKAAIKTLNDVRKEAASSQPLLDARDRAEL